MVVVMMMANVPKRLHSALAPSPPVVRPNAKRTGKALTQEIRDRLMWRIARSGRYKLRMDIVVSPA
jgi:hypothetical protein